MVAQEVVERPPFGRKVNPIANRHHLVVAQLGGDDRSAQSLLFLAPGVERVDLLYTKVDGRLPLTGMQGWLVHAVGAVTSLIFFAAPARAGLISSNVEHEIASGVQRSFNYPQFRMRLRGTSGDENLNRKNPL